MWGLVVLFHVNFSLMIHTVSIWLTLSLAVWRYIMIKFHALAVSLCTVRRCKIVLVLGYGKYSFNLSVIKDLSNIIVVPAFLTIPNYLSLALTPSPEINNSGENITVWRLQVCLLTFYKCRELFFR